MLRHIVLIGSLTLSILSASAKFPESDSLQRMLALTSEPKKRVQLLLNLKDLNEDTELNIPFSIQLFHEAAAIGNTYALSAALSPIISHYSRYTEKQDSLIYYLNSLQKLTPPTPERGLDHFCELGIAFTQLSSKYNPAEKLHKAHKALRLCKEQEKMPEDIYQRAKRIIVAAYAEALIARYQNNTPNHFARQIEPLYEAYMLTEQMPVIHIRRSFATLAYYLLGIAYDQTRDYRALTALSNRFLAMLDDYNVTTHRRNDRPYIYTDNNYALPYRQLIYGAINANHNADVKKHYNNLRSRMLSATGRNLLRNKSYLYETGYKWNAAQGDYTQSVSYIDSLINLINNDKGYFHTSSKKILQIYHDRSRMLLKAGRDNDAFNAYQQAAHVQDSVFAAERVLRAKTLQLSNDMDRMKLNETRATIRSNMMLNLSIVIIGLMVVGIAIYLNIAWRRNKRLQVDIQRHTLKAQESERMKSTFVDSICRGIGPPFNAIDTAAHQLLIAGVCSPDRHKLMAIIRKNSELLLSTLDNMLEAANLDSLTDGLQLTAVEINHLCRSELILAERLRPNTNVEFKICSPGVRCVAYTHAKYFSFVVRALLDNASKHTSQGTITLGYQMDSDRNQLQLTVTDTGCGIPKEKQTDIFRPLCTQSLASQGLSLSLCTLIAKHLSGSISIDDSYTSGARFVFIIPIKS